MAICSLVEVELTHAITQGLDSIFFEASSVRTFASDAARAEFRERWLGSYLILNTAESFMALSSAGEVAGYVIGDLEDPATNPRYADLGYISAFAGLTPHYPAHLHMNVALQHRSQGLGQRLIDAFAAHARAARVPGIHVVTGAGMRNAGFYQRNGFEPLAEAPWKGGTVVLLGRRL
jgi:GNAT superfamily N-acetyltransferase